jgi:hypothetical protein
MVGKELPDLNRINRKQNAAKRSIVSQEVEKGVSRAIHGVKIRAIAVEVHNDQFPADRQFGQFCDDNFGTQHFCDCLR